MVDSANTKKNSNKKVKISSNYNSTVSYREVQQTEETARSTPIRFKDIFTLEKRMNWMNIK